MGCARGQKESEPLFAARQVLLSWCGAMPVQVSKRSGRRQGSQSSCPGNRLRPAVDTEFTGKLKPTCVAKALTLEIVLSPECDYAH